MKIILECKSIKAEGIIILTPSIVLFLDCDGLGYNDLTFAWICFGITLRFGEKCI